MVNPNGAEMVMIVNKETVPFNQTITEGGFFIDTQQKIRSSKPQPQQNQ